MSGIRVRVSGVVALYDACTGFPIHTRNVQIQSDGCHDPLYKGSGVYVFTDECSDLLHVKIEADGYQQIEREIRMLPVQGNVSGTILWMTPDIKKQTGAFQSAAVIRIGSLMECFVVVRSQEEQIRMNPTVVPSEKKISLFQRKNMNYEGRKVLITDGKEIEAVRRLLFLEEERSCLYQLDQELRIDGKPENILIYRGYELCADTEGMVYLPVPYLIHAGDTISVYTVDGKRIEPEQIEVRGGIK